MTRTDVHAPRNIDPANYVHACDFDNTPGCPPYNNPRFDAEALALGADPMACVEFEGHYQRNGHCDHCGTGSKLVRGVVYLHAPTNKFITVGERCATLFERESRESLVGFKEWRKEVKAAKLAADRAEWIAASPARTELAEWLTGAAADGRNDFYSSLAAGLNKHGSLTAKQEIAALKAMTSDKALAATRSEQAAERKPVVAGDALTITGEVVSAKAKPDAYNADRRVMTVVDERGFAVWGTIPASIIDVQRGDEVTFVANVTASDRDNTFGFFKRPRGASITKQTTTA